MVSITLIQPQKREDLSMLAIYTHSRHSEVGSSYKRHCRPIQWRDELDSQHLQNARQQFDSLIFGNPRFQPFNHNTHHS